MKCIECAHPSRRDTESSESDSEIEIDASGTVERMKINILKNGMTQCNAEKKANARDLTKFNSLTFDRDCKLFERADDETIAKRVNWYDGIKEGFKSVAINGDIVYRQRMKIKRRK